MGQVIRNQFVEDDTSPKLLEMAGSPTAICCWNDLTAAGLLVSCRACGIRVPTELAIVGFDGVLDTRLMAQALTTVAVPWDLLGQQAVALLQAQIRGNEVPCQTNVPVRLAPGETT